MRIYILVILIAFFSSSFAQTQIAVVSFKSLGVPNQEAEALTDRLMVELNRTGKYTVLERDNLEKIMEEWKLNLSGCTADECLVEIGQLAQVQQIVGGSISKVGRTYSISARMISVETGEVLEDATFDYPGEIDGLLTIGMERIAQEIAGLQNDFKTSASHKRSAPTKKQQSLGVSGSQESKNVNRSTLDILFDQGFFGIKNLRLEGMEEVLTAKQLYDLLRSNPYTAKYATRWYYIGGPIAGAPIGITLGLLFVRLIGEVDADRELDQDELKVIDKIIVSSSAVSFLSIFWLSELREKAVMRYNDTNDN